MIFDHVFRYKGRTIRLICTIERFQGLRWLTLLDVLATSQQVLQSVPDWKIEYEAMCVAEERGAKYS